jgi:hypothetical protein
MKKLLVFLCAVIVVFAGLLTPCHATTITEFYQSGIGTYVTDFISGPVTSTIDFTFPADQKFTFDFGTGSFVSQNDDLFHIQSLPTISLRVNETGSILGGDPSQFTALVNATEVVDDPLSPFDGLVLSYMATYDVMRDELTGRGSLDATVAGLLITDMGSFTFTGTGSYTSGRSPVPEPTSMLLLGAGLVRLAGFGRKRFKK